MTKEEKVKLKIERAQERIRKKKARNSERKDRCGSGLDCPFDVDMNGLYGTCTCGGRDYESCAGDI